MDETKQPRRPKGSGSVAPVKGRPGVWRLRTITVDPVNGRSRQVSRTVHTSGRSGKTQAIEKLAKFEAELKSAAEAKTAEPAGSPALADLLDEWMAHQKRQDLAPATLETYATHIRLRIKPQLGAIRLDQLTARNLDRFYAGMLDDGLAVGTVQLHHAILSGALRQAEKWGYVTISPARNASPPRGKAAEKKAPSADEVRRLIEAAMDKDVDYGTAIALIAVTGCRRGELVGLKWSDVDWDRGTLLIERSAGVGQRMGGTKSGKARLVSLGDFGLTLLESYRAVQIDRMGHEPDGWLISANGGTTPLSVKRTSEFVSTLGKKMDPPIAVTPHGLRHFAATFLVADGTNIRTVSNRLGHSSTAMTLDVYTHALPAQDVDAANALGRALTAG